jgi:hypothetical protein
MSRKGVPKKKPVGFVIMDLRQLVIVWRMGKPLDAFSIMALYIFSKTLLESQVWDTFCPPYQKNLTDR